MPYDNYEDDPLWQKLDSIDTTLKAMLKLMQARKVKEVATDRELDSQYGDPVVKLSPRDWKGPSMKDRRMSECPVDFLEMLAETLDYFADKAEANNEEYNGKPTAPYKRKDAARARGWAKRIREGKHVIKPAAVANGPWRGGF